MNHYKSFCIINVKFSLIISLNTSQAGPLPNEFTWPVASLGVVKDRAMAAIFASKYTSAVAMNVERGMNKMGKMRKRTK